MDEGGDAVQSRDFILDIFFFKCRIDNQTSFTGTVELLYPVTATQSSTWEDEPYDGVSTKIVTIRC